MPIREDADNAQNRYTDYLSGTAHAQGKAIKVEVDHAKVGEGSRPPRFQAILQRGDNARHRALREGRGLEQGLEGAANPARIAARQVRGDDRFIDLRHSPLIARDDRGRPFLRASDVEEGGAGHGERDGPRWSRQRPRLDAIAVATSDFTALVGSRPERGPQFLMHGRLDRDADVLVDQFAQRDGLKLMRSDRLADKLPHGAFLRWPPAWAAGWSCISSTGRMRPFPFSTSPGTPSRATSWWRRRHWVLAASAFSSHCDIPIARNSALAAVKCCSASSCWPTRWPSRPRPR